MMNLSTSTNIVCERPDGSVLPLEKTLQYAAEAGFRCLDMSFYEWMAPDSPFRRDDAWEGWISRAAETADRLGLRFVQCHAHTYDFLSEALSDPERELQERLVRRSLRCCAILGASIAVTHPATAPEAGRSAAENRAYFQRLGAFAADCGLSLAIENMCDYAVRPARRFFVEPEEIAAFVDDAHDDRLGVCWDFEHGEILGMDQPAAVRLLGRRITATHVSDTATKTEEPFMHLMPFCGTTDWAPIMAALREVGYSGCISLEAHNFIKKLPDPLLPTAMRLSREIGGQLLALG